MIKTGNNKNGRSDRLIFIHKSGPREKNFVDLKCKHSYTYLRNKKKPFENFEQKNKLF